MIGIYFHRRTELGGELIDLDRPSEGLLQVSQQPMMELLKTMQAAMHQLRIGAKRHLRESS
jgi:hypothetical protein